MTNIYIYFGFIFIAIAVIAYPKMKIILEPKVKSNLALLSVLASVGLSILVTLTGYFFLV